MGLMSVGGGIRLKTPVLKASETKQAKWNGTKKVTVTATWTADKSGYILALLNMASWSSFGDINAESLTVGGKSQDLITQQYNLRFAVVKVASGQTVTASITATADGSTIDVMSSIYFIGG